MASFDLFQKMVKDLRSRELLEKGRKPKLALSLNQLRSWQSINPGEARDVTIHSCKKPASKIPVKKLKRMSLGDLRILDVAKGGYVVLRTLKPAGENISPAVEDHEGNVVLFCAPNITADPNPDFDDILPVGTVFILKEPCIHHTILDNCIIRCESPSDMIVLHEGHEMFPLAENIIWKNKIDSYIISDPISKQPKPKTAFEWKERGNALFKKGKFEYAIRCYLIALKGLKGFEDGKTLKQILNLNLSAAYLKHGFFEKALEFSKNVLDTKPQKVKALFRAGRSFYQLGMYEEAFQYFQKCLAVCPNDKVTEKELKKTKDRLLEQKTGVFDMYKFLQAEINKEQQIIDCSDYVGPIKIVEIPGKGRGIVAVKDIEPGTLLVVAKPLLFTRIKRNKSLVVDVPIEKCQKFKAQLAQLICKNPNTFGPIIYDLFNVDRPIDDGPPELFCDPAAKKEPIIDGNEITGIIKSNSFLRDVKVSSFLEVNEINDNRIVNFAAGLYVMPSYFNHSCIPNTVLHIINGVTFVKAIQFIKSGEEICVAYSHWDNFSSRQTICKALKFQCNCQLCRQDRKVDKSALLKRELIRARCEEIQFLSHSEYCKATHDKTNMFLDFIREIQQLTSEMDATYEDSAIPLKLAKVRLYFLLLEVYQYLYLKCGVNDVWKFDNEFECIYNVLKLFEFDHEVMLKSLGTGRHLISPKTFLDRYVLDCVAILIVLHARLGQNEMKRNWIQILCILENIYLSGDLNVIKLKYQNIDNWH